jgi:hypothetical protein
VLDRCRVKRPKDVNIVNCRVRVNLAIYFAFGANNLSQC